ncbi:hypothetical protein KL86DPRO_11632 [uncultured delta proteobacterium]|uniref:Uncharacterized protein n=1 Tax=uncultured delta proteobacterium TaxID=34034 RepID=A0A212JJJ6_9DELT|nr:hypothetical protein KL86DPRO_11632 [uncultured delta proteobacterium]
MRHNFRADAVTRQHNEMVVHGADPSFGYGSKLWPEERDRRAPGVIPYPVWHIFANRREPEPTPQRLAPLWPDSKIPRCGILFSI